MLLPACSSISLHTIISCPLPDYRLFPVRQSRPSLSLVFFKLSSDSNSTPETTEEKRLRRHNATKQFLIYKCGFTPSEIPAIISKDPRLFRQRSIDNAQQALELLVDSGFTPHQVRKTIFRLPTILSLTHGHLKDKIDLFKTLGLEQDVGRIVSRQPRILTCNLEQNLNPKIPLLVNIFGSSANVSKAIKKNPAILLCGVEDMEKKIRVLERSGVKEDEIKEILDKDPRFLGSSINKIEKNMAFLTEVAGFRPSILVKYPSFLNFSLEKRLMPRLKVFEYLTQVLNAEDVNMSLATMINCNEQEFVERILGGRSNLTMLYEKYRGVSVDLDIT